MTGSAQPLSSLGMERTATDAEQREEGGEGVGKKQARTAFAHGGQGGLHMPGRNQPGHTQEWRNHGTCRRGTFPPNLQFAIWRTPDEAQQVLEHAAGPRLHSAAQHFLDSCDSGKGRR